MSTQAFDPADWKSWPDWKLREVYGEDKYKENRDAAIYRQNLKTSNFLKSFLGTLASPVTNALGMMGVPGMIGAGYANPLVAEEVSPQPWIIDENSGKVIANSAVDDAKDYLSSYNAFQDAYNKTSPYEIAKSGLNVSTTPSNNNGNFFTNLFGIGQNKTALGEEAWKEATANSPAATSGAFTPDQRWQQQLKHRQWLADNNRL